MSRPPKLRLTEAAEIDLAEIWFYFVEAASESFATDFLTRIEERLKQGLQVPFAGAPRPHLASGLRAIFYENYALYYLPLEDEIVVVRVLHGARDIALIAREGGFAI